MLQRDRSIVTQAGDTLEKIAYRELGNVSYFRDIAALNDLDVLGQLPIGIALDIPTIESVEDVAARIEEKITNLSSTLADLDLTSIKFPNTAQQLISWIL